jgi:HptB-dependent secretion and biofilm anti anti-sigma factor
MKGITHSKNGDTATISLPKIFKCHYHADFVRAYKSCKEQKYELNFESVKYIDSSALGMLLMLLEHSGGKPYDNSIRITHCSEKILSILKRVNFHKIFTIA